MTKSAKRIADFEGLDGIHRRKSMKLLGRIFLSNTSKPCWAIQQIRDCQRSKCARKLGNKYLLAFKSNAGLCCSGGLASLPSLFCRLRKYFQCIAIFVFADVQRKVVAL